MSKLLDRATQAAHKAASASKERDDAIRAAHSEHTVREIAQAVGLSSARVHQILHGR